MMNDDQKFELDFHRQDNYRWHDNQWNNQWDILFSFAGLKKNTFHQSSTLVDLGCGSRPALSWFDCGIKYHIDPLLKDYLTIPEVSRYWENELVRLSMPAEETHQKLINKADFILCWNVLDHTHGWKKVLNNIWQYAKDDCVILLGTDLDKAAHLGHPGIKKDEFIKYINEYFIVEKEADGVCYRHKAYILKKKQRELVILGTGPSLADLTEHQLRHVCSGRDVIAIKQAIDMYPDAKYHVINNCNHVTRYGKNFVHVATREAFRNKFPDNVIFHPLTGDKETSLLVTKDWERSLTYSAWGPGIMFELAIPLAINEGYKKIIIIGWDFDKNNYTHGVDVPEKNPILNDWEFELFSDVTSDYYQWLLSKGVSISIMSNKSKVSDRVPRINYGSFTMRIGLAVMRCGEHQCSTTLANRKLMNKFHCVHISENIEPYHVAVNKAVSECFDDGAEWVVMLDGDMQLHTDFFETLLPVLQSANTGCVHFKLQDTYINRVIGNLKVVTKKWMDGAGWYQDHLVTDRIAERKSVGRINCDKVVATHFDSPTMFQIFQRFFVRGMKVAAGYTDGINYESILDGFALECYKLGYKTPYDGDPHKTSYLLEKYNEMLGDDGLVCGVCVWGDFPYHNDIMQNIKNSTPVIDPTMQIKYINRLAVGIGQMMKVPHKMFYVSPAPIKGVIPECQWVKLDSVVTFKNLNKFGMYNPDVLSKGKKFIIFDLDNVPVGDLSPMVDALDKSNGWLCRSEMMTTGENIPGGDIIGFTKEAGAVFWDWLSTFLPSNKELVSYGQERLVYRTMVKVSPRYNQYWWEFLGQDWVLSWKADIRNNKKHLTDSTMLITTWGDWKMHRILQKQNNFPWLVTWEKRYMTNNDDIDEKSSGCVQMINSNENVPQDTDIIIWQLCRQAKSTRDLVKRAKSMHINLDHDSDGHVWYVRQQGDTVEVKASPTIAHPNCLMAKQ